uniref:Uncharacterized protein n=1 Tax=Anguilla anguilla TaxID=7936 RepID=A0A0E9UMG7_ANGAN
MPGNARGLIGMHDSKISHSTQVVE